MRWDCFDLSNLVSEITYSRRTGSLSISRFVIRVKEVRSGGRRENVRIKVAIKGMVCIKI